MTDSPPDPRIGSILQDRYKILDVVASGGMGVVYRAERLKLGRTVAIKFLHPSVAAQQSFLQRFDVEARAMSRLSHPNCVSVIDFGHDEVPFLVMDFVPGRSLRLLIEGGPLPAPRALGLVRQILAGLAHAHAQGIIHRDLKPENIIVSDSPGLVDHVRILDFGLAKLKGGPALTVGMAVGTPSYMAPEQTLGEGISDGRTDVYAVGILLFEMLTGRKPFRSEKIANLILMQRNQPPPRMRAVAGRATFSDALEAVVATALAKAPVDRFPSADDMAAALEAVPEAGNRAVAENDRTLADRTLADRTVVDPTVLAAPSVNDAIEVPAPSAAPDSPQQPKRRRRILGVSVGVALGVLLVWALARRLDKADTRPAPPPVPPAPTPAVVLDELAPMGPDGTPGLADAAQLVRLGLRDQAITVLQDIRHDHPRSAYASFLLAVVYFEKFWWSAGLQQAQAAMQAEPAYRRSPKLAKLLVRSLMSDSFWERGAAFLMRDMAEVATPCLQEAAQSDKSPRVRSRATQLLAGR